jgi:microcystin-dependent protein
VAEPIGKIYETAVPSLSDTANIQEALRVYHYGKPSGLDVNTQYNPQNETLSILPEKSIAFYLNSFQSQINAVTLSIRPEFYAKKGNIVSADFDGARVLELSPDIGVTAPNGLLLTSDDSTPTGLKWQAPDITLTNVQTIANKIFANSTIATGGLKFLESGSLPNFTTTLRSPDQSSNKTVIFPTTDAELPGSSTTLVGTDTTQTLTNKTISLEPANNTITGILPVANGATPAGVISQYAGTAAPTGYLLCQGQSVSTTTFAALFAAIGYNYGGSGESFNVPNLQNRVPVGRGTGTFGSLNATGGAETHTLTTAEMPSHTHVQNSHNHTQDSHNHTQNAHGHSASSGDAGSHSHTASTNTAGAHTHSGSASHNHVYYFGQSVRRAAGTSTGEIQNTIKSVVNSETTDASFHTNVSAGGHTHTVTVDAGGSHSHTVSVANATAENQATTATNQATTATNQNTGGDGAHNNLQPYIVVNYIIKT